MILQGVKLTIQPLGVRYANRPKKAKMGGYVAFSPIYACLALIEQPLRGDSIAFGSSTSQRIYSKPHTHNIGKKRHKYGLRNALHTLDGHCR